jgi:hypothetical protein
MQLMTRIAIAASGLALSGACLAQERVEAILEEIEAFPEDLIGEWKVGGRRFVVDAATKLDLDHPAEIGKLAEVEFVMRDGVAVAVEIEPQAFGPEFISDGPYVRWKNGETVEVRVFHQGRAVRHLHPVPAGEGATDLPVKAFGDRTVVVRRGGYEPPPATWDAPSRLLAISDIEGNHDTLLEFLEVAGVVDADGRWAWGDGHLLFNGDIVDRGHQVTETMWLIRRLDREAEAAGGRVHYVLGNHEAMVMAGDLRYIHLKYRFTSGRLATPYHELFGPHTEIGRWWRSCNGIVRVGPLLFVHAGYSPALDELDLDLDQINDMIRSRLGPPAWPDRTDLATSLTWHRHGPLWYRGYFDEHAAALGGKPTDAQLRSVLERHDAKHIVVGHTVVDDIRWLDDNRRLIGIDVHWRDDAEGEGLLLENGELWRVGIDGKRTRLEDAVEKIIGDPR